MQENPDIIGPTAVVAASNSPPAPMNAPSNSEVATAPPSISKNLPVFSPETDTLPKPEVVEKEPSLLNSIAEAVTNTVKNLTGQSVSGPALEEMPLEEGEQGNYVEGEQGGQGNYVEGEQGEQGDYVEGEQGDYVEGEQGNYVEGEQGNYVEGEQGDYVEGEEGDYVEGEEGEQEYNTPASAMNLEAEKSAALAVLEKQQQVASESLKSIEAAAKAAEERMQEAIKGAEAAEERMRQANAGAEAAEERMRQAYASAEAAESQANNVSAEEPNAYNENMNTEEAEAEPVFENDYAPENMPYIEEPVQDSLNYQPTIKQGKILTNMEIQRSELRQEETENLKAIYEERFSWIPEKDRPKVLQSDIAKITSTSLRHDDNDETNNQAEEKEALKQSIIEQSLLDAARRYVIKVYNKSHPNRKISDLNAIRGSALNPLITNPSDAPYVLDEILETLEKKTYSVRSLAATRDFKPPQVSYTRAKSPSSKGRTPTNPASQKKKTHKNPKKQNRKKTYKRSRS
jgi:hypothetical protein